MTVDDMRAFLHQKMGEGWLEAEDTTVPQPWWQVRVADLQRVCQVLHEEEALAFDFLHSLSGVDYGEKENRLGVVYHLSSLAEAHHLVLKVRIPRDGSVEVPSVAGIWRAADWHEREAYDLLGITFSGHPDLRRILLPADWEGHPLRKDYKEAETYHDINIAYEDEAPPDWQRRPIPNSKDTSTPPSEPPAH